MPPGADLPLLRREFGNLVRFFDGGGAAAGIMLQMLPEISDTTFAEESLFLTDPFKRVFDDIVKIDGTLLAHGRENRARAIRARHNNLNGEFQGREYNALRHETFMWPGMAFRYMIEDRARRNNGLTAPDEKQQLNNEWVRWIIDLGVDEAVVPKTQDDFDALFDKFCCERLEVTDVVRNLLERVRQNTFYRPSHIPESLWEYRPIRYAVTKGMYTMTAGGLPEAVRERFPEDIPWTARHRKAHTVMSNLVRGWWATVPEAARYSGVLRNDIFQDRPALNARQQLAGYAMDCALNFRFEGATTLAAGDEALATEQ